MMRENELRDKFKKLIIMKCHPECKTYSNALLKFNKVSSSDYYRLRKSYNGDTFYSNELDYASYIASCIGNIKKGITLNNVLIALGNMLPDDMWANYDVNTESLIFTDKANRMRDLKIKWVLKSKEYDCNSPKEATSDDQSTETIVKLVSFLEEDK